MGGQSNSADDNVHEITPLHINGEDVLLDGHKFHVINSSTSKSVGEAQGASKESASHAAQSSHDAFPGWKSIPPQKKRRLLQDYAQLLQDREELFVRLMMQETSCTEEYARHNMLVAVGVTLETAALATAQVLEGSIPTSFIPGCIPLVLQEPLGVILSIGPWNAPMILGMRAVLGPLITGNTVVFKARDISLSIGALNAHLNLKGSELCPQTHHLMVKSFTDAGFPPGVVNLVQHRPEDASEICSVLVAHPAVRKVTFTGSSRVGSIIAATAAKHLKPTLMELGGKCPVIVLEDADLDAVIKAVEFGALDNNGQICMATERIIVVGEFAQDLAERLQSTFATTKFPTFNTIVVTEAAAKRTESLLQDALHQGGKLVGPSASELRTGASLKPVVILGLTPEMRLFREESFGPCVSVIQTKTVAEAIDLVNASSYGLSASIFTRDVAKAIAIARKLESGAVHVNSATIHDEDTLPHGGVKDSGFGRFGGRWGIQEFVKTKTIMVHGIEV
ncbi:hypothetical protein LTR02_016478 [Friedmanniomyces endolithicus]|nr:hypothetical protein LTR02_016478 [Friedmanniomyces endolithicus]